MFQFKINHNILYTREKLFKAKITDDDKCQLCGKKQTLEHLFVECQQVDSFWNFFSSWWNSCNLPKVTLTCSDKIYAHHPEKQSFCALNFCLIVARFYIYTSTRENEPYSFLTFKIMPKSKLSSMPPCIRDSVCLQQAVFFLFFSFFLYCNFFVLECVVSSVM